MILVSTEFSRLADFSSVLQKLASSQQATPKECREFRFHTVK